MRMRSGRWEMVIRPERGGRITSLRLDGQELLDQGIGIDKPTAKGFVEGGAFGWDEMVPNVEPTSVLPDHGEAWRLPWSVSSVGSDSCVMSCRGRVVPWQLERRIQIGDAIEVSYRYTNVGSESHYAYWCAHPLFKFETRMDIGVTGGEALSTIGEGKSAKEFLEKGSVDAVWLRWRSGLGVEVRWDVELTPYVAIWVCNGDLGGYRQIAIEPATGGNDRPDAAAPPPFLAPGETLEWWLRLISY